MANYTPGSAAQRLGDLQRQLDAPGATTKKRKITTTGSMIENEERPARKKAMRFSNGPGLGLEASDEDEDPVRRKPAKTLRTKRPQGSVRPQGPLKLICQKTTPVGQILSAAEEDALALATKEAAEIAVEQAEGVFGPAQVRALVRDRLRMDVCHLLQGDEEKR